MNIYDCLAYAILKNQSTLNVNDASKLKPTPNIRGNWLHALISNLYGYGPLPANYAN